MPPPRRTTVTELQQGGEPARVLGYVVAVQRGAMALPLLAEDIGAQVVTTGQHLQRRSEASRIAPQAAAGHQQQGGGTGCVVVVEEFRAVDMTGS